MVKVVSIFLGATLVAACSGDDGFDAPEPISGPPVTWRADVVSTGTYAVTGAAQVVLADDGQSFSATIQVTGGVPNATYPWHVHAGTCGQGGPIIGDDAYPPLMINSGGAASVSTIVLESLDAGQPYSVNVHLSRDDLATIIACGNLGLRAGV